jgi:hypothetical protein
MSINSNIMNDSDFLRLCDIPADVLSTIDSRLCNETTNQQCCEKPDNVNGICQNCCSQLETISFIEEMELNPRMSNRARINKFREFVFSKPINNFCRVTLIDLFPRVEHAFFDSDRTNFVNLNQLTRELLPLIGYGEYLDLFPPLKTKSRCLQIKKLVEKSFIGRVDGVGKRLEDLDYLEPKCGDIDMSKAVADHTYSNINNIDAKTLFDGKTKTQTQTKGKEGSQKTKINFKINFKRRVLC